MAKSAIEWTESTWNPVTGCSKVSPGCKHCYAERMARRLHAMVVRYTQAPHMPHPRQAGVCSRPAIPWARHGIIDTRR